jgi:hypothetical protein
MCKFRFKIEEPAIDEETEKKLCEQVQVPDALCALVIDSKGDITVLRTRQAKEAQTLGEHHDKIQIQSIDSPPATISIISATKNPKCVWMTFNGTSICVSP